MTLTDTYEQRKAALDKYVKEGGIVNKNTTRMMVDYNRYYEAQNIGDWLTKHLGVKLNNLNVLDFGCGVADYGIYFGRAGAVVGLVDIDEETLAFAKWRFAEEDIDLYVPERNDWELVIYGECLDHLEHPLDEVKSRVDAGVRYIFTSSYPFRASDPNESHWQHDHHPKTALEEQEAVRKLLEDHYDKVNFGGQQNLWIKRNLKNL